MTVAHQAPPSMGFSRQECWSGLPFPSPGDLLYPGIEPRSPALQADALTSEPSRRPIYIYIHTYKGSYSQSYDFSSAGSLCEESHLLQRSWGRKPDKRKDVIWLQGFPLDFSEHLPPKTRVYLPYCTVLSTLLTLTGAVPHHLSLEKVNRAPISLLLMKRMSPLKTLW